MVRLDQHKSASSREPYNLALQRCHPSLTLFDGLRAPLQGQLETYGRRATRKVGRELVMVYQEFKAGNLLSVLIALGSLAATFGSWVCPAPMIPLTN